MAEPGDDKNAARPMAEAPLLDSVVPAERNDVRASRTEAELLRSAQAIDAAAQCGSGSAEATAMLERVRALHGRARHAARRGDDYVLYDCVQQIDRELVSTQGEDERRALAESSAAALRSSGAPSQRAIADALMRGSETPSVATCQALLRERQALEQERRFRVALVRRQLPRFATLLIAAVVFFALWALAGGFEWIVRQDVEITLAMLFTTAVLMGFFGSLLSVAFGFLSRTPRGGDAELASTGAVLMVRPFIGAALAVPIVLAFESGLLNLGDYSPAVPLALSFVAGFLERLFVRRLERAVP